MSPLERLCRSLARVPEDGAALAFERMSEGWTISGPYRSPCFVEPGRESDCNDFAVPGISQEMDAGRAFDLCAALYSRDDEGIAKWGLPPDPVDPIDHYNATQAAWKRVNRALAAAEPEALAAALVEEHAAWEAYQDAAAALVTRALVTDRTPG